MPRKRFSVEQIINHLREAEVLLAQGQTVGEICRHIGVSEQSYYRWRREYGGLKIDQARRLNRHFPANLQIHGNRIYIAPPRELHSLRSPPMTRLWRADHVRKAIWQRFPPSRHTSPVFSTLPSISSAYAGTGLRRRSSIKAKIFWNKIFDTATSASWNVT